MLFSNLNIFFSFKLDPLCFALKIHNKKKDQFKCSEHSESHVAQTSFLNHKW